MAAKAKSQAHAIEALGKKGEWLPITKHETKADATSAMKKFGLDKDKFRISPYSAPANTGVSDSTKPGSVKIPTAKAATSKKAGN